MLQNEVYRNDISFEGRQKQGQMERDRIRTELQASEMQIKQLQFQIGRSERQLEYYRKCNSSEVRNIISPDHNYSTKQSDYQHQKPRLAQTRPSLSPTGNSDFTSEANNIR